MTTILFFGMKAYMAMIFVVAAMIAAVVVLPVSLVIRLGMSFHRFYKNGTFVKQE